MGAIGLIFAGLLPNIISLDRTYLPYHYPGHFRAGFGGFLLEKGDLCRGFSCLALGAIVSGLWTFLVLPGLSPEMQSILEPAFIGVVASFLGLVAGSYATKAPSSEKWQLFASP